MPVAADNLADSSHFHAAVIALAHEMLATYNQNPRMTSIFAAQQRWLMAHAGFALHSGYPEDPRGALYSARFIAFILKHKVASRNTAAAFIQEMLAYRFVRPIADLPDGRTRLLEPTEISREYFWKWLYAHLTVLDGLDGCGRAEKLQANPALFAVIQPRIATQILASERVRNPGDTFNLFNWANSGGVVMDYLISRLDQTAPVGEVIVIGPVSLRDMREQFLISNTHLKRLLSQAGAMGSTGWTGAPGKSDFWISRSFYQEYIRYQAAKFAIIDDVSQHVLANVPRSAPGISA